MKSTTVCTYGLTCKFRETCSKIHIDKDQTDQTKKEVCRFGSKCTRYPKCPFSHPSPPPSPVTPVVIKPPCTFGDLCTKYPACRFAHEPECRYGFGCENRKVCKFGHPKFKFEKELEEKVNIILATGTSSEKTCMFNTECTNFKCAYKHEETKSGKSKQAEKIIQIWKNV